MSGAAEDRPRWLWLGLLSTLVQLGAHPQALTDFGGILPSPQPALLATGPVWEVPLALLPGAQTGFAWPFLVLALVLGAMIAAVCRGTERTIALDRVLAVIGLSLLVTPADFGGVAALCGLAYARSRPRPIVTAWLSAGVAGLAVLVTLDFGLVLMYAVLTLTATIGRDPPAGPERMPRLIPLVMLLAGLALASALWPGFAAAAQRPVSWMWLRPPVEIMPSLSPAILTRPVPLAFLAPFYGLCVLPTLWKGRDPHGLLPTAMGTILGLGCQHYSALAGLGLVAWFFDQPSLSLVWDRRPRLVRGAILAVAGLRVVWLVDFAPLFSGPSVARQLRPADWDLSGPVILRNLDRAPAWRAADESQRFPLLADDRWDAVGVQYPRYAALCRDLREVRDHRYLLSNGEWGGYRPWLTDWSPALIVVETTDLDTLRSLSLSPDWRILGLDGERTIFGRADEPRHLPQMRHALNCLMTLEWPARLDEFTLAGTIVAGNAHDDRAVAGALCALRFPYAALRFVRHDGGRSTSDLRARCYLELAHRVARYSSAGSLLDQSRAMVQTRAALQALAPSSPEYRQTLRGLEGLRATADGTANCSAPETALRTALLAGRDAELHALLAPIDEPLHSYYAALIAANRQTPEEIGQSLQTAIAGLEGRVSEETLSEAHFYLGCAALEAGDALQAIAAFQDSANLAPNLPFREIRRTYLQQLTR
jgi:hypothetical protein